MPGKLVTSIRRLPAVSVFAFGVLAFGILGLVSPAGHSWADDSVPLPQKKPALSAAAAADLAIKGEIVQYSLKDIAKKDFTEALLDFGEPPLPGKKPVLIIEGPLPDSEAEKYKRIFALQADGKMKEARKEMAKLRDMRLRSHVLYQRYMHPTAYISSFDELHNWLALYADQPGARKIHKLAVSKMPKDFRGNLRKPEKARGIARRSEPMMVAGRTYRSPRDKSRSAEEKRQVKRFKNSIRSLVNRTRPSQAWERLTKNETAEQLDPVEYDILQAKIAVGYLHAGKIREAYDLASASAKRSGLHVPISGWVAGLVAWGEDRPREAAGYFEVTARSPYASSWTAAAGSYWAARSHMRAGSVRQVSTWLKRAMEHPRTFYGLIATRALGRDFDFNWDFPAFTEEYHALLEDIPAGSRAMALVAAGQNHLAEAELLRINPETPEMRDVLLSYAGYAGLPALAMRIGSAYEAPKGMYYDAALYPKGNWKPREGYKIDPALIHAIMRQESKFDHRAESPRGAKGLMQLMPATARHVAGRKKLGSDVLMDPQVNLELGEKYIADLLDHRNVDGDLIKLLVAYNAGPGNLSRWKRQWASVDDPLLFIELIPSRETRAYVERVLANYWIYRLREDLPTPTLDALAEGRNARYADAQAAQGQDFFQLAFNR